ncbi:MAG: phosphotransferase [Micrococcaceae bacterium]|nr:phosphotransferase [Micrococcaceae bacterium]
MHGRVLNQVLPGLRDPEIWKHPLVAGAFDASLCVQLTDCDEHAVEIGDERGSLPLVTLHGDACPNKMLVTAEHDGFSLIDYGFFGKGPIGFDLGQLLVGDVQIGRGPAARLQAIDAAILSSYVEGLRAEGCQVSREIVRRAHALHLMLFTGLSCLPIEHLGSEQTPALHRIASERAAVARFSLELLRTSPPVTPKAYEI